MHEERDAGAGDLPATDATWRRRDILGWGLAARLTELEYDPQPPFAAGSPESAGRALADDVRSRRAPLIEAAHRLAMDAARTIGNPG